MVDGNTPKLEPERLAQTHLIADVGNAFDEDGLTRLDLSGAGELVIELHRAREGVAPTPGALRDVSRGLATAVARRFVHDFGREAARDVLVRATHFGWSRRFPPRPGIPSEPVLEWRFVAGDGATWSMKVWLRDAETEPEMGPVVAALRYALESASKGELYL